MRLAIRVPPEAAIQELCRYMHSMTSTEVNEPPIWIICDINARYMMTHPDIYFILLNLAAETVGICPKKPEIGRDANDLPGFVVIQLMDRINSEELKQIVNKIEEELSSNVETEKRKWGEWVTDFSSTP